MFRFREDHECGVEFQVLLNHAGEDVIDVWNVGYEVERNLSGTSTWKGSSSYGLCGRYEFAFGGQCKMDRGPSVQKISDI